MDGIMTKTEFASEAAALCQAAGQQALMGRVMGSRDGYLAYYGRTKAGGRLICSIRPLRGDWERGCAAGFGLPPELCACVELCYDCGPGELCPQDMPYDIVCLTEPMETLWERRRRTRGL